jgi:hypothetical protein
VRIVQGDNERPRPAAVRLCCAHALRELAGVADTADPDTEWCWARQCSDAIIEMQRLVNQAVAAGTRDVDPEALAEQIRLYRSAAQIGVTETASRTTGGDHGGVGDALASSDIRDGSRDARASVVCVS